MGRLGRTAGVLTFTAVETVTLGVWLAIVTGTVDTVGGVELPETLGLAVLIVGLVVEGFVADLTVNGRNSIPVGGIVAFSLVEAGLWVAWLAVAREVGALLGVLAAGLLLLVTLVPLHTIEDNVLRGEGFLSEIIDTGTVGSSLAEAVGATVWLALIVDGDAVLAAAPVEDVAGTDPALVGLAALAVFLLVEHELGIRYALR